MEGFQLFYVYQYFTIKILTFSWISYTTLFEIRK